MTSRILDRESGEVCEVRSRYLIAADGAGSRVRKSLGIEPEGPDRLQTFVMIHFKATLRDRAVYCAVRSCLHRGQNRSYGGHSA